MRKSILVSVALAGLSLAAFPAGSSEVTSEPLPDDESVDSSRASIFQADVIADAMREAPPVPDISPISSDGRRVCRPIFSAITWSAEIVLV